MPDTGAGPLALPNMGFRRFMFFNRFAVERDEGFVQIHFGFVNRAGSLADSYSTAISEFEVSLLEGTMMDYLGKQADLLEEPPQWQAPILSAVEPSNHIVMARHGNVAETLLYSFSHWSVLEEAKKQAAKRTRGGETKKEEQTSFAIVAEAMALLRSPLRTQQHLIRLLFPRKEALLPGQ